MGSDATAFSITILLLKNNYKLFFFIFADMYTKF